MLPPGVTLISLIERNVANVGDSVAYRYLDHTAPATGRAVELTWTQLGRQLRAVGARVQRVADRGDRVAILAPRDSTTSPASSRPSRPAPSQCRCSHPNCPGHAERLDTALNDAAPSAVLTTTAAAGRRSLLARLPAGRRPHVIVLDEIPESAESDFAPTDIDVDDVSHLQYTSGSTRPRWAWRSLTARSAPT